MVAPRASVRFSRQLAFGVGQLQHRPAGPTVVPGRNADQGYTARHVQFAGQIHARRNEHCAALPSGLIQRALQCGRVIRLAITGGAGLLRIDEASPRTAPACAARARRKEQGSRAHRGSAMAAACDSNCSLHSVIDRFRLDLGPMRGERQSSIVLQAALRSLARDGSASAFVRG